MADAGEKTGRSVGTVMTLFVLVGLVLGVIAAMVLAPWLMLPLAIGGALTGGAIGTAVFLFARSDQ